MSDQYLDNTPSDAGNGDDDYMVPPGAGDEVDRGVARAMGTRYLIDSQLGFTITDGDPEARDVLWQTSNPEKFTESYQAAMVAKAARLGVRVRRSTTQPNLAEQFKSDIRNARGKGSIQYRNILAKYRAAGLDVDSIRVFDGNGK
jgi:hypothetical protein